MFGSTLVQKSTTNALSHRMHEQTIVQDVPTKRIYLFQDGKTTKFTLLSERTLENHSKEIYSNFFNDIYTFLFNFDYDLKDRLLNHLFCESACACTLPYFKIYCLDLFSRFNLNTIDAIYIQQLYNLFEKVKLPYKIAIQFFNSLRDILKRYHTFDINTKNAIKAFHGTAIIAFGKLAKNQSNNQWIVKSYLDDLLNYVNLNLRNHDLDQDHTFFVLGKSVEAFSEFNSPNSLNQSFDLIVQMYQSSNTGLHLEGLKQFAAFAKKHKHDLVFHSFNNIENNAKFIFTGNGTNIPDQIRFHSELNVSSQIFLRDITFSQLFEIMHYLEVIIQLSIDNLDFIDYLMDQIALSIQYYDANILCFFSQFMHKYSSLYPSVAQKSFDVLFSQLENPNYHIRSTAATELTKIICTTNVNYKPYLDEASYLLEDDHIKSEVKKVIIHSITHFHLPDNELENYLNLLIQTVDDEQNFLGKKHPAIQLLQILIQRENKPREFRLNCLNTIIDFVKHKYWWIRLYSAITLGELAATIVSFGDNWWQKCIDVIFISNKDDHRTEALGNFAFYCKGNEKIVAACSQKIFDLLKTHTVTGKYHDIRGISMLLQSTGITNELLQKCLQLSSHLENDICIKKIREAAQFWHQDLKKFTLILAHLKTITSSCTSYTFKELHILAETPGLAYEFKKACYMIIFENLKCWNHSIAQECMEISLKNNSISSEIIIAYLKCCISLLIYKDSKKQCVHYYEEHSIRLGFVNVCLYYEKHPQLLTSEIRNLLIEGKNKFTQFPSESQ